MRILFYNREEPYFDLLVFNYVLVPDAITVLTD